MTQLQFKDGDDEGEINETYQTIITSCNNGYIVQTVNDEGDYTTVYNYEDGEEMIKYLRDILGIK